jgi:hypothetical protein
VYSPVETRGVAQVSASVAKQRLPAFELVAPLVCPDPLFRTSCACGVVQFSCSDALAVGHNEDALALMRRASFSRREEANRRRETHVP